MGPMTTTTMLRDSSGTTPHTDPRPFFARAVDIAEPVIAGVQLEQLDLPSPCIEYSVRELLDHLVFVLRRVAALGRGDEAFAPKSLSAGASDRFDWAADWRNAAVEVESAWADESRLHATLVLPWAAVPGGGGRRPKGCRCTSARSRPTPGIWPRQRVRSPCGTTRCADSAWRRCTAI